MAKDKLVRGINCDKSFDPRNNRAFVFDALPNEEKLWPSPALENMHKEWWNFQIVKCPQCGSQFRTRELKLLGIFSPTGLLVFVIAFILSLISYFILIVLKGGF